MVSGDMPDDSAAVRDRLRKFSKPAMSSAISFGGASIIVLMMPICAGYTDRCHLIIGGYAPCV